MTKADQKNRKDYCKLNNFDGIIVDQITQIMECFKKCQRLIISSINPYHNRDNGAEGVYIYNFLSKVQCSDKKRCLFCKLVKEIRFG